jgi:hypothetical protein
MSDLEKEFGNSPLRESALQLHEMYLELRASGFSKKQSLYLVSKILTTAVLGSIDDSND